MEIDLFSGGDMAKRDFFMIKREASIRVHDPRFFDTENILRRAERFRNNERSKERLPRPAGFLKAKIWDLTHGGMNLEVIIPMEFISKDLADLLDRGELFDCAVRTIRS
jgi:hypothetical protein